MEISSLKQVMQLTKRRFATLIFSLVACNLCFAQELVNFEAKYKAFRFGKEQGHATMTLESLGDNRHKLTYGSKVSVFFLSDKRTESSEFTFKDNIIQPVNYEFKRTGTGRNKSLKAQFDEKVGKIVIDNGDTLPWQGELDNQLYRLDLQHKLAKGETDFEYSMLNYRGQIRGYRMKVMGKEQLKLPYGTLEGIKVKIMRESKKRETFAWFAPELNYQMVRLQQFKEGDEQGDVQLSEYIIK